MQLFDALQQLGDRLLELADRGPVAGRHVFLQLDIGMGQLGEIHHELFALGEELVQRRVERADDYRESVHRLEQAGEILALHGQELGEGLAAGLLVAGHDHCLHVLDAVLGEEHVLGAAQADALGAELLGHLGIARDVRIGANAELAAELVGPSS